MARRLSLDVAALIFAASQAPASLADALDDARFAYVTQPRPTITRAADIVQQPAERVLFGTQLVFKQRQTARAAAVRRNGFQIRIFPMNESEDAPRALVTIDDCNIYVSTVHLVPGDSSSDIMFGSMDERWLAMSHSRSTVRSGHYLLVFESVGPGDNVFRLHRDDAEAYFATGFRLTVEDSGQASLEKVRAAYEARHGEANVLYREIDRTGKDIPCYRYHHFAGDDAPRDGPGNLAMCATRIATES